MVQRISYDPESKPIWVETWIVACGPSSWSFDLHRLDGKSVIAVNDSIFMVQDGSSASALAVFSVDLPWVTRQRRFLERFSGHKFIALPEDMRFPISGVRFFDHGYELGLSDDPQSVSTGGNSGYAAINVAYLLGAEEIHLVGYDMNPREKFIHAQWAPRFKTMLPQLSARGVKVINHNQASFIHAFPKEV